MEIDDMESLWNKYDARLDASLRLNALLVRGASLGRAETALSRLGRTLRIEVAINALAVFLLGGFAADHAHDGAVLAFAALLDIFAVAILIAGIVALVSLGKIDYDDPVLVIAGALDRLRLLRARTAFWTLALAPLLWPPLLIVGLGAFGIDAVSVFGAPWIVANLAFGAAVLATGIWFARKLKRRDDAPAWVSRLHDTLAGRDLRLAHDRLDTLVRYERDDSGANHE